MENTEELSQVLEGYEVELIRENNVLNIIGMFDEDMVNMVYEFINNLADSDKPIQINISSRGGETEALFAIIDALKSTGRQLHGRVNGYAYSSALGLLCVCDKRSMGDMSTLMYHTCSYACESTLEGHKQYLKETEKIQRMYDNLIINASNLTQKDLNKYKNKDWYIDKEDAIKLGIINI